MSANTPIWIGYTGGLTERPNSGRLIRDRSGIRMIRIFDGQYSECIASCPPYGTPGAGDMVGFMVLSGEVTQAKGDWGTLTITFQVAYGGDTTLATWVLPPDRWSFVPQDLQPRIEKNPLFYDQNGNSLIAPADMNLVYQAVAGPSQTGLNQALSQLQSRNNNPDDYSAITALYLVNLLKNGHDTYYLAGGRYTWTTFSFYPFGLDMGGYIQSPYGPGEGYLPNDFSWLRLADQMPENDGTHWYRLIRTWLGAPGGSWNPLLYGGS